mmetsp:Transcript_6928/g.31540  ORF Transcript_6928/g.31540 Transcript_6928/m.31540 type:complete len:247 (-) Transcript_6928:4370-5110(-)
MPSAPRSSRWRVRSSPCPSRSKPIATTRPTPSPFLSPPAARRALPPWPARRLNRASPPPGPRSPPRARRGGSSPRFPPEPSPSPTRRRANPAESSPPSLKLEPAYPRRRVPFPAVEAPARETYARIRAPGPRRRTPPRASARRPTRAVRFRSSATRTRFAEKRRRRFVCEDFEGPVGAGTASLAARSGPIARAGIRTGRRHRSARFPRGRADASRAPPPPAWRIPPCSGAASGPRDPAPRRDSDRF